MTTATHDGSVIDHPTHTMTGSRANPQAMTGMTGFSVIGAEPSMTDDRFSHYRPPRARAHTRESSELAATCHPSYEGPR